MKETINLNKMLVRYLNKTPDLVCIASKDGYFINVSDSVVKTLGYSLNELLAHPIAHFIHPADKALTAYKRAALLEGETLHDFENRYRTKSGDVVWLHWTSVYFKDAEVVFAIAKNNTRRKQQELGLKERFSRFKTLVRHFKTSLEKDKKQVAVELHEELAQLAAVVKADIQWIKNYGSDAALQDRIEHALSASELLVHSIRNLSYSISPAMIEDLGFADALEWLCAEFTLQHNIPCSQAIFCEEEALPHEVKLDLFRICQEALNNCLVQGQPQSITIHLAQTGKQLVLTITDDGEGFEQEVLNDLLAQTSLRERVESLHGVFSVESTNAKGTTLVVSFALEHITPAPVLPLSAAN